MSHLSEPFIGEIRIGNPMSSSQSTFGYVSDLATVNNYDFNCAPWTFAMKGKSEHKSFNVANSLSPSLSATLFATCIYDKCSNQAAANLDDLPQALAIE